MIRFSPACAARSRQASSSSGSPCRPTSGASSTRSTASSSSFPYEPDGVYAIARQWVPIEEAALCEEWEAMKDAFEEASEAMSAPFETA